jgi:hypothetical protein
VKVIDALGPVVVRLTSAKAKIEESQPLDSPINYERITEIFFEAPLVIGHLGERSWAYYLRLGLLTLGLRRERRLILLDSKQRFPIEIEPTTPSISQYFPILLLDVDFPFAAAAFLTVGKELEDEKMILCVDF